MEPTSELVYVVGDEANVGEVSAGKIKSCTRLPLARKTSILVIFLTGRGGIPSTVRAMKGGAAVDFLTKPVDEEALFTSVERALRQDRVSRQEAVEHASLVARI